MAIYAISDLHLSFGIEAKPMDIFGSHWSNYVEKIEKNWNQMIKEDDTVLMAGDFSWATYLEESKADFEFLEKLPGQKIILKGNHDYWWTTLKKMNEFLEENEFKSIKFLYNNVIEVEGYFVCGTRYWANEDDCDNEKIYNRECERAKISLNMAKSLDESKPIIFMTHYMPDERIINCIAGFNVKCWIYGHIHSNYEENIACVNGVETYLTSCDYLRFVPFKIA